jgi:hypothetical protein
MTFVTIISVVTVIAVIAVIAVTGTAIIAPSAVSTVSRISISLCINSCGWHFTFPRFTNANGCYNTIFVNSFSGGNFYICTDYSATSTTMNSTF